MRAPPLPSLAAAVALATTTFARAAEPSEPTDSPANYAVALFSTTFVYRPPQGPLDGPQYDISPSVGFGRYVTPSIALELDAGPTFIDGRYASFSLVPGVVWGLSPWSYAAARFLIQVEPRLDVALAPGIGVFHTFDNGCTLSLELNVSSYLGRGQPDLGLSLTVGALYSF